MMKTLITEIRSLRSNRASNYGNLAYQNASGDIDFKRVPEEIWKLWYDRDSLSFMSIYSYQALEALTDSELNELYDKEVELLEKLKYAFSKLNYEEETRQSIITPRNKFSRFLDFLLQFASKGV